MGILVVLSVGKFIVFRGTVNMESSLKRKMTQLEFIVAVKNQTSKHSKTYKYIKEKNCKYTVVNIQKNI